MKECIQCGAVLDDFEISCKYCGKHFASDENPQYSAQQQNQQDAGQEPFASYQPPRYPDPPGYDRQPGYQPQQYTEPQGYDRQPGYQQPQYAPPPTYQPPNYQQRAYPQQPGVQPQYNNQPGYGQPQYNPYAPAYYDPALYYDRSKIAAGILGIILGGIGVHKFYLGRVGLGIVYVLFCWTGIPSIIGLIEGIIYLCMSDDEFREKYCRRFR